VSGFHASKSLLFESTCCTHSKSVVVAIFGDKSTIFARSLNIRTFIDSTNRAQSKSVDVIFFQSKDNIFCRFQ
jgi:hypothetical protein